MQGSRGFLDRGLQPRCMLGLAISESLRENNVRIEFIQRAARLMEKTAVIANRSASASFGDVAGDRHGASSNLLRQTELFIVGKSFRNCVDLGGKGDRSLPSDESSITAFGHSEKECRKTLIRYPPATRHPPVGWRVGELQAFPKLDV